MRFGLKTNLLKLIFWVMFKLRVYYSWSKLYRILFERKYRKFPLTRHKSIEDLSKHMSRLQWKPDGIEQLGDAVEYPGKAEYFIFNHGGKVPEGISADCDLHSIYAVHCLRNMHEDGYLSELKEGPYLMSVTWTDPAKLIYGHNVAVWSYLDITNKVKWAHMSNWHSARPRRGFHSIGAAAHDVLGNKDLIGYAWCTKDLDLKGIRL